MHIPGLGLEIRRVRGVRRKQATLQAVGGSWFSGWWPIVHEPFTGAWQRNVELSVDNIVTNPIVWSCATLIASDISKLWLKLLERDPNGIWTETERSAFSPVLRKPNRYSTRIKFFEYWMLSKLLRGNAYALKSRDARGVVDALYVLDPASVVVLIAPDGSVFYQIGQDNLAGIETRVTVPAREIIHDIMVPLYHPLVGVSPIHASGMAALQGLKIQSNSAKLFANGSQPGGMLTSPHQISTETAERLQKYWEANYAGQENVGKVAVLGDGLEYKPMTMTAVDAQLIDQLKWSDERICATFHVPGYMVGLGPAPPYTDIQSINLQYYNQALQAPIENLETLLDEGLDLPANLTVEFDLDALLRMDTKTQVDNATKGILGGLWKPNEERAKFNRKPVPGGDTVYMQQQQFSLAALSARDTTAPAPIQPERRAPPPSRTETPEDEGTKQFTTLQFRSGLIKHVRLQAAANTHPQVANG